jgi:hypothetical protein
MMTTTAWYVHGEVRQEGVSLAVNVTAIGGYLAFDKVAAADQNS